MYSDYYLTHINLFLINVSYSILIDPFPLLLQPFLASDRTTTEHIATATATPSQSPPIKGPRLLLFQHHSLEQFQQVIPFIQLWTPTLSFLSLPVPPRRLTRIPIPIPIRLLLIRQPQRLRIATQSWTN